MRIPKLPFPGPGPDRLSYALDGTVPLYQYDSKGYPIRDLSSLE